MSLCMYTCKYICQRKLKVELLVKWRDNYIFDGYLPNANQNCCYQFIVQSAMWNITYFSAILSVVCFVNLYCPSQSYRVKIVSDCGFHMWFSDWRLFSHVNDPFNFLFWLLCNMMFLFNCWFYYWFIVILCCLHTHIFYEKI